MVGREMIESPVTGSVTLTDEGRALLEALLVETPFERGWSYALLNDDYPIESPYEFGSRESYEWWHGVDQCYEWIETEGDAE